MDALREPPRVPGRICASAPAWVRAVAAVTVWLVMTVCLDAPRVNAQDQPDSPAKGQANDTSDGESDGGTADSAPEEGANPLKGPPDAADVPTTLLPEVVVTGTRVAEDPLGLPRAISVVDRGRIRRRIGSSGTPAELLRGEPGVFVQQTGRRGGAPIIRGLIGKFVLPLYDGVRLTDGTIFSGPNSFFNNVDRFSIDHIEVVRGPSSVFYGSDAIGGTLNMIPKRFDGFPDTLELHLGLHTSWQSVSNQVAQRIELSGGHRRFNFFFGGTYIDAGDTSGGGSLGSLSNTSWTEKNVDLRVGYLAAPGQVIEASYSKTQRENIFRFDQPWDTPHQNAWWAAHTSLFLTGSGLRKRMAKTPLATTEFATLSYTGTNPTPYWTEVKARTYWRGEFDETVRGSEQATTTREDTTTRRRNVWGAGVQFTSRPDNNNRVVYGVDARLDDVQSGSSFRETFDKTTGMSMSKVARTPRNPDARFADLGAFLYDEYSGFDRLTLSAGLRFNYSRLTSDPTTATTPSPLMPSELDVNADLTSLTWSVGSVYKLSQSLNAVAHVASGFRSPSISDTLRTGEFTFGVGVPSPGLDAEKAITVDVGLKGRTDRTRGSVTGFYTDLRNLIDSRPGTFGGVDFIDLNGDGIKQPDEQVFVKKNVGKAYVWGIEAEAEWEFIRHPRLGSVRVFGNATYTRGRNRTDSEPLRFIPPINGIVGLRWESPHRGPLGNRSWVELLAPWSTRKRKKDFAPRDLRDAAQFPREKGRLPGWILLDLRAGIRLTKASTLSVSITNLFNKEYQSFGSRIPGDGRSFNIDFGFDL